MFWSICSCFFKRRIFFLCFIRSKVTRDLVLWGLEGTLLWRSSGPTCILSPRFAFNRSWSAFKFWLQENHGCRQTSYRRSQITPLEQEPDISELRQKFIRNKTEDHKVQDCEWKKLNNLLKTWQANNLLHQNIKDVSSQNNKKCAF